MRGNILCCVLVLALGSHAADLIHEAVNETQHVYLPCPPPVEDKVTWSVERNGAKIDIITYDGDKTEKHIKGNSKIYTVIADQYKSLYIQKAELSDSGKYFCNNKSVNLTVIPSGTKTQTVKEGRNTTLKCSSNVEGSYKTTWRREVAGKSEPIRFPVPVVGKKVILTNVHLSDFGLYFCDGKPAVYLNVTKNMKNPGEATQSTSTTTRVTTKATTTTTEETSSTAAQISATTPGTTDGINTPQAKYLVISLLVKSDVLILLTFIIIFISWNHRSEIRGVDKQCDLYDDIMDVIELQPTNDVQSSV